MPMPALPPSHATVDVRAAVDESPLAWAVIALAVAIALTSAWYIVVIVRDITRTRR